MDVYHFLNKVYGLKVLKEKRLKVSDMNNVNDPFDFLSIAAPTKADRQLLKGWLNEMSENYGLLCFSRDWQNPVLWSHYADRHRGLCLGFEIPNENLRQVNYVQSRPIWPRSDGSAIDLNMDQKNHIIDQLLYTKFAHWSYEDEYRLFTRKFSKDPDGNYYVSFNDNLKLVKVIVGARSDITRKDIELALGKLLENVETFKARPAFHDFRIVRQKDESQWH